MICIYAHMHVYVIQIDILYEYTYLNICIYESLIPNICICSNACIYDIDMLSLYVYMHIRMNGCATYMYTYILTNINKFVHMYSNSYIYMYTDIYK